MSEEIKIKDEPVDPEYDKVVARVKTEPEDIPDNFFDDIENNQFLNELIDNVGDEIVDNAAGTVAGDNEIPLGEEAVDPDELPLREQIEKLTKIIERRKKKLVGCLEANMSSSRLSRSKSRSPRRSAKRRRSTSRERRRSPSKGHERRRSKSREVGRSFSRDRDRRSRRRSRSHDKLSRGSRRSRSKGRRSRSLENRRRRRSRSTGRFSKSGKKMTFMEELEKIFAAKGQPFPHDLRRSLSTREKEAILEEYRATSNAGGVGDRYSSGPTLESSMQTNYDLSNPMHQQFQLPMPIQIKSEPVSYGERMAQDLSQMDGLEPSYKRVKVEREKEEETVEVRRDKVIRMCKKALRIFKDIKTWDRKFYFTPTNIVDQSSEPADQEINKNVQFRFSTDMQIREVNPDLKEIIRFSQTTSNIIRLLGFNVKTLYREILKGKDLRNLLIFKRKNCKNHANKEAENHSSVSSAISQREMQSASPTNSLADKILALTDEQLSTLHAFVDVLSQTKYEYPPECQDLERRLLNFRNTANNSNILASEMNSVSRMVSNDVIPPFVQQQQYYARPHQDDLWQHFDEPNLTNTPNFIDPPNFWNPPVMYPPPLIISDHFNVHGPAIQGPTRMLGPHGLINAPFRMHRPYGIGAPRGPPGPCEIPFMSETFNTLRIPGPPRAVTPNFMRHGPPSPHYPVRRLEFHQNTNNFTFNFANHPQTNSRSATVTSNATGVRQGQPKKSITMVTKSKSGNSNFFDSKTNQSVCVVPQKTVKVLRKSLDDGTSDQNMARKQNTNLSLPCDLNTSSKSPGNKEEKEKLTQKPQNERVQINDTIKADENEKETSQNEDKSNNVSEKSSTNEVEQPASISFSSGMSILVKSHERKIVYCPDEEKFGEIFSEETTECERLVIDESKVNQQNCIDSLESIQSSKTDDPICVDVNDTTQTSTEELTSNQNLATLEANALQAGAEEHIEVNKVERSCKQNSETSLELFSKRNDIEIDKEVQTSNINFDSSVVEIPKSEENNEQLTSNQECKSPSSESLRTAMDIDRTSPIKLVNKVNREVSSNTSDVEITSPIKEDSSAVELKCEICEILSQASQSDVIELVPSSTSVENMLKTLMSPRECTQNSLNNSSNELNSLDIVANEHLGSVDEDKTNQFCLPIKKEEDNLKQDINNNTLENISIQNHESNTVSAIEEVKSEINLKIDVKQSNEVEDLANLSSASSPSIIEIIVPETIVDLTGDDDVTEQDEQPKIENPKQFTYKSPPKKQNKPTIKISKNNLLPSPTEGLNVNKNSARPSLIQQNNEKILNKKLPTSKKPLNSIGPKAKAQTAQREKLNVPRPSVSNFQANRNEVMIPQLLDFEQTRWNQNQNSIENGFFGNIEWHLRSRYTYVRERQEYFPRTNFNPFRSGRNPKQSFPVQSKNSTKKIKSNSSAKKPANSTTTQSCTLSKTDRPKEQTTKVSIKTEPQSNSTITQNRSTVDPKVMVKVEKSEIKIEKAESTETTQSRNSVSEGYKAVYHHLQTVKGSKSELSAKGTTTKTIIATRPGSTPKISIDVQKLSKGTTETQPSTSNNRLKRKRKRAGNRNSTLTGSQCIRNSRSSHFI